MSKEKYYNKIKRYIYRKFEELEVFESSDGNEIYLYYKGEKYAEIRAKRNVGELIYYYGFSTKIIKPIPIENRDFEILLRVFIEDTFQMKVNDIYGWDGHKTITALRIPYRLKDN